MTEPIDTMHLGTDRVIGVWEREGAVIDPGPESTLGRVLAGLPGPPSAVFLTHIHLDHAGATGAIVERYPEVRVFVHEAGAPHLIDPGRLLASARRLYGEEMDALWGAVLPVPERNVVALSGGERIAGLRVLATPGHASHHVTYMDERTGDAYVGDVAGVLIPPSSEVWAPTPPPDIDIELWEASIGEVAAAEPTRLCLTHFGAVDDPAVHLEAMRAELRRQAEAARPLDRDRFLAALGERIGREDGATARRIEQAMPPDQVWLGLERYWRKRAQD